MNLRAALRAAAPRQRRGPVAAATGAVFPKLGKSLGSGAVSSSVPLHEKPSRHGIKAAFAERMAAKEPSCAQPSPLEHPVALHSLPAVLRAGRVEAAG